jgi:hypothetical protein
MVSPISCPPPAPPLRSCSYHLDHCTFPVFPLLSMSFWHLTSIKQQQSELHPEGSHLTTIQLLLFHDLYPKLLLSSKARLRQSPRNSRLLRPPTNFVFRPHNCFWSLLEDRFQPRHDPGMTTSVPKKIYRIAKKNLKPCQKKSKSC